MFTATVERLSLFDVMQDEEDEVQDDDEIVGGSGGVEVGVVVEEEFDIPDDVCGRPVRWVKPKILLLNLLNRFDAILAIPY